MNNIADRKKNLDEFGETLKSLNLNEIEPLAGVGFCNSIAALTELVDDISKCYEDKLKKQLSGEVK